MYIIDKNKNKLYWLLDHYFGRRWNNFKDFIGHPSDPKWIRWIVDHIPGYYPHEEMEKLNNSLGYKKE